MLLQLSGVIVPKRQNPSLAQAGVTAVAGHRGTPWGVPRLSPPACPPPSWEHGCVSVSDHFGCFNAPARTPGKQGAEVLPVWDEVTCPIRGDSLTSEVAITSSPSQAGAVGAWVLAR